MQMTTNDVISMYRANAWAMCKSIDALCGELRAESERADEAVSGRDALQARITELEAALKETVDDCDRELEETDGEWLRSAGAIEWLRESADRFEAAGKPESENWARMALCELQEWRGDVAPVPAAALRRFAELGAFKRDAEEERDTWRARYEAMNKEALEFRDERDTLKDVLAAWRALGASPEAARVELAEARSEAQYLRDIGKAYQSSESDLRAELAKARATIERVKEAALHFNDERIRCGNARLVQGRGSYGRGRYAGHEEAFEDVLDKLHGIVGVTVAKSADAAVVFDPSKETPNAST